MAQLRRDYQKITETGTTILVIGPENAQNFQDFWANNKLQFIGLPDPKLSVLKLYGQQIKLFRFGRMPAMVIVDKSGIAQFVHYGKAMSDIPDNQEVLETLNQLNLFYKQQVGSDHPHNDIS